MKNLNDVAYALADYDRKDVRNMLKAALFDGDDRGKVTMSIGELLDEVVELFCRPQD